MGLFNNVGRYTDVHEYIKNFTQQTQSGLKLDSNNNYDIEGKRLANVGQGVDDDDAVVMYQMASLDTGLETKLAQLKADSLQVDGSSHMTGDLDLRGQKLINPGEIQMDRKLITNLGTDEDNDLSAVNMITLKKYHPDVPEHTHEVTKDIDLKELFNVVKSKQQTWDDLKTNYDNLVSYNDIKNIFVSRKETFPMETALDMGNQTIFNVKDPTQDDQGTNKRYVDKFLPLSGGTMKNDLSMGGNKITNIGRPMRDDDAATKKFVLDKTNKCLLLAGGTMKGPINMGGKKVTNLGDPTAGEDAATKDFVEKSHVSQGGLQQNVFLYQMLDDLESSSESNITVTGIKNFPNTPHTLFKKAYHFTIGKNAQNEYNARIGFNFYRVPTGAYTYVVEYFPPFMIDVSVDCRSTPLNVNKQIFKKFPTYVKNIVQIHKWQMATPDYLMIDLKSKGGAATPTRGDGRLIVYGIEGTHNDVSSSVLDAAYVVENGKMVMETDLDLNGKRLLNHKSKAFFFGRYVKGREGQSEKDGVINHHVFGFDFTVKKVTLHVTVRNGTVIPANTRIQLQIKAGKVQGASGVDIGNNAISYSFDFAVSANEELTLSVTNPGGITQANMTLLIEI